MAIVYVPFTRISSSDVLRPWLQLIIKNPHTNKELRTLGIIDTGADEVALPASYAPMLGHNLQSGSPKQINTGNGLTVAYSHTTCIEIDDIKVDNVLVDFLPNLNVVLIGVKNCLANFILTIDYPAQKFSLQK